MRPVCARWSAVALGCMLLLASACGGAAPAAKAPSATVRGSASASPGAQGVAPGQLTAFDRQYLAKYHLPASTLGNLKQQLTVPQAWSQAVQKNGTIYVRGDWHPGQWTPLYKSFHQRYPNITIHYTYGANSSRVVQVLTAFKEGKFLTDVTSGVTGSLEAFLHAHALASLKDLPNWGAVPASAKDTSQGTYVSFTMKFWGIAYNTNKVTLKQLPKTWSGVLTDPVLRGGNLALGNRPELWIEYLWGAKGAQGQAWAQSYIPKLFALKPQLRNESMAALPQLLANGTFSAVIPAASYLINALVKKGAPVSWYSPQPIIADTSDIELMSNARNPLVAKIFINWLLSGEGQLADWVAEESSPIRTDMQQSGAFYPFAAQTVGKRWAYLNSTQKRQIVTPMDALWRPYWR